MGSPLQGLITLSCLSTQTSRQRHRHLSARAGILSSTLKPQHIHEHIQSRALQNIHKCSGNPWGHRSRAPGVDKIMDLSTQTSRQIHWYLSALANRSITDSSRRCRHWSTLKPQHLHGGQSINACMPAHAQCHARHTLSRYMLVLLAAVGHCSTFLHSAVLNDGRSTQKKNPSPRFIT
jgi:hypothetical protein